MKFKELINRSNFLKDKFKNLEDYFGEIDINGITNNSKIVKKNFIFFALPGNKTNGNLYIELENISGISDSETKIDSIKFYNKIRFNLKEFKIIEKISNCYYLKKNVWNTSIYNYDFFNYN